MRKQEIRKLYLEKRKRLPLHTHAEMSQRIKDVFLKEIYSEAHNHLHLFLPIQKLHEVDTWPIVDHFRNNKLPTKVVISKSDVQSGKMINYYYNPEIQVVESKWGIPEPETGEICDNLSIDVVLVPLLAFDNAGHRVGYGKGFYDRFLSLCRSDAIKVGLSFDEPLELIEDVNEYDIILDCVITPETVYWFKK